MNLIEALKKNEWIYRKSKPERIISGMIEHEMMDLTREEILADDWEIEPRTVAITREQFDAAWRRAEDVCENMEIKTFHYLYELIVRELGL
jgi:hypothetical protein